MTEKYHIGLIGCGGIAHTYARELTDENERAELTAAVEINDDLRTYFASTYNIAHTYTSATAMLANHNLDLVIIATPPATHATLITEALESGVHVWCEKPMVTSLAEADAIQAVVERTGKTCSSVFQWRFGAASTHFKNLIDANTFGRPLVGICHTLWYRTPDYYDKQWRGRFGGASMNLGIHAMDFLLWLQGEWLDVNAVMDTLDHDIDAEDVLLAHVRFKSGMLASIINSAISPRQSSYMRMDFQKATIELEHLYQHNNDHWKVSIPDRATYTDELKQWQTIEGDYPASQTAQLIRLLSDLEQDRTPMPDVLDVRNTLEFLTCLYKSAATGQPVRKGSITPGDVFYDNIFGEAQSAILKR